MSTKSYNLSENIIPSHYKLLLKPNLESGEFIGTVDIDISVKNETYYVELNALELDIKNCEIISMQEDNNHPKRFTLDNEKERLNIEFMNPLKGSYKLHIEFSGKLNDLLHGFYRSKFKDDSGVEHTIATTQFESTDARRAFPCWDEPSFKATFQINMEVEKDQFVVSNAPIKNEKNISTDIRRIEFENTIKMSTYLVAFIVGPFEATDPLDVDGVPLRIIYPKGKGHLTKYALDAGAHALRLFTSYYDINYPGQKLDMVAIPDFAFGAMENLGCITYREVLLLVDKNKATESELLRIADVIAHEIAHMWFGDLVTMKWWNGIWLNEAFATFMATYCSERFNPDWHRWDQFSLERSMAFDVDSLENSRPIEYPVISPKDADGMFDLLTYEKGGSVLRMLEQFIGPDKFRDGVRHYLKKHSFSNTDTKDLWDSIEHVTNLPISKIMQSWIFSKGYPLIEMDLNSKQNEIILSQKKFSYLQSTDNTLWDIPILIKNIQGEESKILLSNASEKYQIRKDLNPLMFNSGGSGFYRVTYTKEQLNYLRSIMFKDLSPIERYSVLDDTWASLLSNNTTVSNFYEFLLNFSEESDMDVWTLVSACLYKLEKITDNKAKSTFQKQIIKLVEPKFSELGWKVNNKDNSRNKELRGVLIRLLGLIGNDKEVIKISKEIHKSFILKENSYDPNILAAITSIVAANGQKSDYKIFFDCYLNAENPQIERRYLNSLSLFPGQEEISLTLEKTINGDIRTQDSPYILAGCLRNQNNGWMAWNFIKNNWSIINEKFPSNSIVRMISPVSTLDEEYQANDIENFFSENDVPQGEKTLNQTLEKLKVNVEFKKRESIKFTELIQEL